ncbi:MAG: hypothetical protein ACJAZG_001587, partial [Granulosicoccus sp.]
NVSIWQVGDKIAKLHQDHSEPYRCILFLFF